MKIHLTATAAYALVLLCSCGLAPEKVKMDDPRLTELLAAARRAFKLQADRPMNP